jgi:hypothetical protein
MPAFPMIATGGVQIAGTKMLPLRCDTASLNPDVSPEI